MGLVNRVVPHDTLMSTVREIATEMATLCSPRSIRIMKQQLYGDLFTDLATSMEIADRGMVAASPPKTSARASRRSCSGARRGSRGQ